MTSPTSASVSTAPPPAPIGPVTAPKNTRVPFLSPQTASYFVAGGVAGAASRTVVSPLERLKIIQ